MFTLTGSPPSRRRGLKFKRFANLYTVFLVASFAEAWIEMYSTTLNGFCSSNVASFAEAWIEIADNFSNPILGLVASFAEAWIEICDISPALISLQVASFAEAWIEIGNPHYSSRCCYIVSSQR